ncbi:hypothetical protein SEA_CARON_79 [Microbacterium phage Caron]|uniref:Uncharacterized protein n=1 Tax=Microbacterium phage Caron TaxID=3028494 RepID=A0AAE9ZLK0_9CAUD|nr:hypothetical protein SEA_CARON_79 [Microbacterium phage Caron]
MTVRVGFAVDSSGVATELLLEVRPPRVNVGTQALS